MKQIQCCLKEMIRRLRLSGVDGYYVFSEELIDECCLFGKGTSNFVEEEVTLERKCFMSLGDIKRFLQKKVMELHHSGEIGIHIVMGGWVEFENGYQTSVTVVALGDCV